MLEIRKSKCHPNTPIGTDGAHCAPRYAPLARTAGTGTGAPRLRRCAVHRGTGRQAVPPIRVQALRAVPCAGTRCAPVPCVLWSVCVYYLCEDSEYRMCVRADQGHCAADYSPLYSYSLPRAPRSLRAPSVTHVAVSRSHLLREQNSTTTIYKHILEYYLDFTVKGTRV